MSFAYQKRDLGDLVDRSRFRHRRSVRAVRIGKAFEATVKIHFQTLGFFVLVSAGSRTLADLVAVKKGQILFIQCKLNEIMKLHERQALYRLADNYGAMAIFATTKGMWRVNATGQLLPIAI